MTTPLVFPFQPIPEAKPRLSYEFLTDVMISSENRERRQALREVELRRYSYTILLEDAAAVADFRHAWYAPEQMLRYSVPLWSEAHFVSAIAGDAISGDFTNTEIREGERALLYSPDGQQEEVTVVEITDGLITTEDPVVGTFTIGLTKIAPIMIGWMSPPTVETQSAEADRLEVAFIEEFQGIAGIDTTMTEKVAAIPASIEAFWVEYIQPYLPVVTIAVAIVKDANGARIPNYPINWSNDVGTIAPSIDRQSCRHYQVGDSFLYATAGDFTATLHFITLG